jgi:uncharacterized protein (TIGR02594 family)
MTLRWMDTAWTFQGLAETAGPGSTPEIVAMFRDAGHASVTDDAVPWCAAFVGACLVRGGVPIDAVPVHERLRARAYLKIGTEITTPRVGALAVFSRGSDPRAGHVAFVTGWTETTIAVLGGNQGDKVSVGHFPRGDLVGLRWPEPPADVSTLARAGSRVAQGAVAIAANARAGLAAAATGAGAAISAPAEPVQQVVEKASGLMSAARTAEQFAVFAWQRWPWVAGALVLWCGAKIALEAGVIGQARVEDHNTGANPARSTT